MSTLHRLENLTGYQLQGIDGEIGKMQQIYFDDETWIVRYFVVHTGGWLLGREVLITPGVVTAVDESEKLLTINLTCKQIEGSPPVDTEVPISRHYEREYFVYYGWTPYWSSEPVLGIPAVQPPALDKKPTDPEHPHLRSSREVQGYRIKAKDEEIGHLTDMVLEDCFWSIRYFVVECGSWFAGHKVLVSPSCLLDIDWSQRLVSVDLTSQQLQDAPKYEPDNPITADYEKKLHKHYGSTFTALKD